MSFFASKELPRQSAKELMNTQQKVVLSVALVAVVAGLVLNALLALKVLVVLSFAFYVCFVGFKVLLHFASGHFKADDSVPADVDDPALPVYTIIVPLYKEARVLRQLVESLSQLEYPKDRLQVLLLLEEDDMETRAEAAVVDMPDYFEVIVVPHALPKGKPKALNVGLAHARPDAVYCVVYDAEDRPEPYQLLKAVTGFRAVDANVGCIQARLQFWNLGTSWVTRFYWAEYVVHFNFVLPGLAKLGLIPPLGGTSNHFRVEVLRNIAFPAEAMPVLGIDAVGGWDAWNVTEDAELAAALALYGYSIRMIDSYTLEEATARIRAADRQRRRWLKGYLQTGLVYTRHPIAMARRMGFTRWFTFNLLMLGTPISLLLNPLYWGLTIAYFATRSEAIEQLFPGPVFYTGLVLLVAGNVLLFWQLLAGVLYRQGHGTVKYMLLVPIWWAVTSYSCYRIIPELLRRKTRHTWHKTEHGHDITTREGVLAAK